MSTGTLLSGTVATLEEASVLAQEAGEVSVAFWRGGEDRDSLIWRQVNEILKTSLARSGFIQPDVSPSREKPPPWTAEKLVVVAPGIVVRAGEYEQRYGGIDLEQVRQRMSSELYRAFVRHIGSIPGDADLDINTIATIPE